MTMRDDDCTVATELCAAMEGLCGACRPAIRVARVPSGLDYRFVVAVEAPARAQVYAALAPHVRIPPDAGPLNLSRREALRLCELVLAGAAESTTHATRARRRQPGRLTLDLVGPVSGGAFQL